MKNENLILKFEAKLKRMREFKQKTDENELLELHKKQTHRKMNEQMNKKNLKY